MPLAGAGFGSNLAAELLAEGLTNTVIRPIGGVVSNVVAPGGGLAQSATGDKVFATPVNTAAILGQFQGAYNTQQILNALGIPVDLLGGFNTPAEASVFATELSQQDLERKNRSWIDREVQTKLADYMGAGNVLGINREYDTLINRENLAAALGAKALDAVTSTANQSIASNADSFRAAADYAKGVATALTSAGLTPSSRY